MFLLYIMDNFVNTRKNFLEAQVEAKFALLRLRGLQKGLASGGAFRLRLHNLESTSLVITL